ncbi:MAG: hypothetical protein K2X27_26970 [Candidatus Obscuribacterales bacterium]|nr:hypothetical protein [Candidatus Obscuribacterales bacterium]
MLQAWAAPQANTPAAETAAIAPKLYGRIEQLVNDKGAALPKRLQKLTPILDQSQTNPELPFSGKQVKSFPVEWEGTWKGDVKVLIRESTAAAWLAQPASAYRANQFFRPGEKLSLLCRFSRDGDKLNLSPPTVQAKFKHAEDLIQAVLVKAGEEFNLPGSTQSVGLSDLGQKTIPFWRVESFSFGKRYGQSTGGNFVDSDVLSNQLQELSTGTIEQDLFTSGTTRSLYGDPSAVSSYDESVVRFSRVDSEHLYVKLAYVSYQADGFCLNKCILEGTLQREGD